jgi:hypothetical protein
VLKLADLLEAREAKLYLPCQLREFETYLQEGAVLTPSALPSSADGDGAGAAADEGSGGSIRLAMTEPGRAFARENGNLPEPRGPIVLQVLPDVLRRAQSIRCVLRPADGSDNGIDAALSLPLAEIEYLFRYTREAPLPERSHLKSAQGIEKEFGVKGVESPELFCRFDGGRLPFDHVQRVLADYYLIRSRELRDWLYDLQAFYGFNLLIERRYCLTDTGGRLLNAVIGSLEAKVPPLKRLGEHPDARLRRWAAALLEKGLEGRYRLFARGLRQGTLLPLLEKIPRIRAGELKAERLPAPIPGETRRLIDKLVQENVPPDSIARITEVPLERLSAYLAGKHGLRS